MRKIKMFHGTTDTRIHKILLEGLKCKAEKDSNIWENGRQVKAVCLTRSKRLARLYANRKCNIQQTGCPLIITLDVPQNRLLECKETLDEEIILKKDIYCTLSDLPRNYIRHISATKVMDNWNIINEAKRIQNGKY